jgi:hypothetical protein
VTLYIERRLNVGTEKEARIRETRYDFSKMEHVVCFVKNPAIFRTSSEFLFWEIPIQDRRLSSLVACRNLVANGV